MGEWLGGTEVAAGDPLEAVAGVYTRDDDALEAGGNSKRQRSGRTPET